MKSAGIITLMSDPHCGWLAELSRLQPQLHFIQLQPQLELLLLCPAIEQKYDKKLFYHFL